MKNTEAFTRADLPEPEGAVLTARGGQLTVPRERGGEDTARMSRQVDEALSSRHIPQPKAVVSVCREYLPAIRRERDRSHPLKKAFLEALKKAFLEAVQLLAACYFKQAWLAPARYVIQHGQLTVR